MIQLNIQTHCYAASWASGDASYWDMTAASAWSLKPSAFVTFRIVSKPGTLSPDRAL